MKTQRIQNGWRYVPGDVFTQVLTYSAARSTGWLVKRAPTPDLRKGYIPSVSTSSPYVGHFTTGIHGYEAVALNKAYAKFKDASLGESSEVGLLMAERREALGMVADRAIGLYRATWYLRRGKFRQFLKELSVDPRRRHRGKIRNTADEASKLWLEYWFGWSPTVSEVYNLTNFLSGPMPSQRYQGACTLRLPTRVDGVNSSTNGYRKETCFATLRCQTGARTELVNPNLHLAAQMGLANPASIAWELVPFSFVVDWFTGFGDVLAGFSDFAGVKLHDAFTSVYLETDHSFVTGFSEANTASHHRYQFVHHQSKRTKSLHRPTVINPLRMNLNITRAATAASLLTQGLLSLKR